MSVSLLICTVALGILGWTWIVYPALIWLLSRLYPEAPGPELDTFPSVSAILATRDDAATIAGRVADFLAADYPADRLHVVVGVDGATEAQLDAVRRACASARVTVVASEPHGGKALALNAAVHAASGDMLVFSDSQQSFARDAIVRLVSKLLADSRLGAVGGALQLPGDLPDAGGRSPVEWYWAYERQLRAAEARVHSCVGVSGSIYAMRRRDWEPMPAQLILDDVWLPMRLVMKGRRIGYDLHAKAWDARSTSSQVEKNRKVRTLTGNFQLLAWMPGVLIPLLNPIWLQFVSHKVLRLLTPWLLALLAIGSLGVLFETLDSDSVRTALVAVTALAGAVLILPFTRPKVARLLAWGWSLQTALVEATLNGMRGRWNVWR